MNDHDRTRHVLSEESLGPAAGGEDWLIVEVRYRRGDLGGARGYLLWVGYEGRAAGMRTITLGSARGVFLEPAARFSAKRLAEIEVEPGVVAELRADVLARRAAERARYAPSVAP